MANVRRSALLPYSSGQVFDLVNDVERYPEFLPWCREAKIVDDEGEQVVAELTIRKGGIRESFTTRNLLDRPRSIALELVEGPFKRLSGLWCFTELAENGSKVDFELDFEMAASLIDKTLGILFAHAAGSLVDAFCRRARDVYGRQTG